MTELVNIFNRIAEEQELYHKVKTALSTYEPTRSNMLFNYYLYNAIYQIDSKGVSHYLVVKSLKYFIAKETNLNPKIAVINNTYQMAIMLEFDQLLHILMGQQTNLLLLNSDAAKLGALMALDCKLTGVPKSELLRETLL